MTLNRFGSLRKRSKKKAKKKAFYTILNSILYDLGHFKSVKRIKKAIFPFRKEGRFMDYLENNHKAENFDQAQ